MATKIGILDHHQNPMNARPLTFVKKSIAELLVRRLVAEWVGRKLIRMCVIQTAIIKADHPQRLRVIDYGPSESIHGARLRWEPPKSPLTPLKPHPWAAL